MTHQIIWSKMIVSVHLCGSDCDSDRRNESSLQDETLIHLMLLFCLFFLKYIVTSSFDYLYSGKLMISLSPGPKFSLCDSVFTSASAAPWSEKEPMATLRILHLNVPEYSFYQSSRQTRVTQWSLTSWCSAYFSLLPTIWGKSSRFIYSRKA